MTDIITTPIKFAGATVLSFNCQLGLGSSESELRLDLVEDCENNDSFNPRIGAPYYFEAGGFAFNGLLSNWDYKTGQDGRTYSVTLVDPRQLLEDLTMIIGTYLGEPKTSLNYVNLYNSSEGTVLNSNCFAFGSSGYDEKSGMPYNTIISELSKINPTVYSPTNFPFTINWASFPTNVPSYYKISGPNITAMGLLENVCELLGYEFYVYLSANNSINIGLIDLKSQPTSFSYIVDLYQGIATDISYGQEIKSGITKTILFGEKQHYLSRVNKFNFFFGVDLYNTEYVPVVPFRFDDFGFWINKKIDSLNLQLDKPLATNGPYTIHELDIRSAMASQQLWERRVFNSEIGGSFNQAVKDAWPQFIDTQQPITVLGQGQQAAAASGKPDVDMSVQPTRAVVARNKPDAHEELKKIWSFIKNLGDTYYGKAFITPLNQTVCYHTNSDDLSIGEKIFTDLPTNAGGWVDPGIPVLGLNDPELTFFREEDGRVGCFAFFDNSGIPPEESEDSENTGGSFENDFISNINPKDPTTPIV